MLFNSMAFALFFVVVFSLYWLLRRSYVAQNVLLLGASYFFYGWWDTRLLLLIVITTAVAYGGALSIRRGPMSRAQRLRVLAYVIAAAVLFLGVDWRAIRPHVPMPLVDWAHLLVAKPVHWYLILGVVLAAAGLHVFYPLVSRLKAERRERLFLTLSLVAYLALLGFFKYFNFFADTFRTLAQTWFDAAPSGSVLRIVLPVGISFYTFLTISYTVDVYRRQCEPTDSLLEMATYVAFFPLLLSGPIERGSHLLVQFQRPRHLTWADGREGLWLIVWGLYKKVVVADRLTTLVSATFTPFAAAGGAAAVPEDGLRLLITLYAFALQIYCDFSGYTDMARGTARLLRVGKVLFGLVYGLAAGEVFLRLFAAQPMLPRYVCPTSYGIRGNTPGLTYRHRAPEYSIEIRTNAKGMRADREIPYEKPPGLRRVLLLGDSFGMGYGVSLEDMFLTRLTDALTAAGVPCESVNLSVSGYGTAEELVALQEEGFGYVPDLVLVAWHITDLDDNVRSNLYGLDNGRLVRRNATYLPAVQSRQLLFRLPLARWLAVHSHLYCCLREKSAITVKNKLLPMVLALTQTRGTACGTPAGKSSQPDPYPGELAVALLSEIQRQCEAHGAHFLILDIPERRSRTEFYSTFPVTQAQDRLAQFHLYSPMEDFRSHYGEKLYWEKEHGHFTPLGCRIVGEGLARTVLELGWFKGE